MRRRSSLPCLLVLLAGSPTWAAPPRVFIAASVDGGPASASAVLARRGQKVTLHAVVEVGQGKHLRYVTTASSLILRGRRVPAARLTAPSGQLRFSWSLVEPYPSHVSLPSPNPGNPAYSNARLFGPDHGRWLGYDTIEYHETVLPDATTPRLVVTSVSPTDEHVNVHDGLGTMRYKVNANGPLPGDPTSSFDVASPGAEAREEHGISSKVMRVSFRRGDDIPGWLTAYFNVPNVFGSGGNGNKHQAELFQGADCADVIIGALRAAGVKLPYSSVTGLFDHAVPVTPKLLLDDSGVQALLGGKAGAPVRLEFGTDVRVGDIMLIDYVNAADLPRAWDHVAIVSRDRGTIGEFDIQDLVLHMGYLYGLTEAPASSEGPAVIQFLRWKPRVTRALARVARRVR